MRQFFQRLLLPIAVIVVTQTSFVSAESIRLVGPNGQVQPAPQYSENIVRNSTNNQPGKFFGPTSAEQTLWSIASQLRPSSSVTVQQTLLAIYQLNPQAFENQNIHTLIPGSTLRVPSLAQISSNTNQEAANIMAAHKAKLNPRPAALPAPVRSVPVVKAVPKTEAPLPVKPVTQPKETAVSEVKVIPKPAPTPSKDVLALEEKNHTLRVMLSQVQSEVSSLKQELGDENRIRSEVERLLEEERRKAEEAKRLAPSSLDNLLSNGWFVALLALIPGLLLAIIVLLILNRRSAAQQESQTQTESLSEQAVAPVAIGPEPLDDIGDDLLLDDDLFNATNDKDAIESEPANQVDDVFADLNETEIDFNLSEKDTDDLFVGIDDDGDLDTEFDVLGASTNGISVNADEKALGIEEMERALNQTADQTESDDLDAFDLADEDQMSDDEINALLAGDDDNQPLSGDSIDQSLLDELLAGELDALDDGPSLHDAETLDTLLNDELDLLKEENIGEFDLSSAGVADDQILDELLASIEAETDLEPLKVNAVDDTQLLDEMLSKQDESPKDESMDLFDELMDDLDAPAKNEFALQPTSVTDSEELDFDLEQNQAQPLAASAAEYLAESESESESEPEPEFVFANEPASELNNTEILDELIDDVGLDEKSLEANQLSAASEKPSVEEHSELFEELLDVEPKAQQAQPLSNFAIEDEFNSDTFIDDLLNSAPAKDPLLEPPVDELDLIAQSDDFDFNPEIESGIQEDASQQPSLPANEFGIPQDDDWVFEEDNALAAVDESADHDLLATNNDGAEEHRQAPSEHAATFELPVNKDEESFTLNELDLPNDSDGARFTDVASLDSAEQSFEFEPEIESLAAQALQQEPVVEPVFELPSEPASSEVFATVDDLDLPEYTEEDALADAQQEPLIQPAFELPTEPASSEVFATVDDIELPEYTEADALADALQEPAVEPVFELPTEPASSEVFATVDDLDLPEYTEEDALADAPLEPVVEPAFESPIEPASSEVFTTVDDLDLPEYTEADALADEQQEPAVEPAFELPTEPASSEVFATVDDFDLPEYTEEDALADAVQEPAVEPVFELPIEPASSEVFATVDDLELPEYTEEDALADALQEPAVEPVFELPTEPAASEVFATVDDLDLPEYTEADALADVQQKLTPEPALAADEGFANVSDDIQSDSLNIMENVPSTQAMAVQAFEEEALHDWLSEHPEDAKPFSFDRPLDAQTIASAGMDIDAMLQMGGEDWNGFRLTPDQQAQLPDEVPEDEQAIWASEAPEPQAKSENWGSQEEALDFDPQRDGYMTIDELMAKVESEEQPLNLDEEELKLEVGLDEFPDVIGDVRDIDVDSGAEAAGKLDLAKIYIEMNDENGAIKLLEEAIVDGDDEIRQQAKRLIDVLNGRV